MQFRTQIPISKSDQSIGYDSELVSLGSCFAVNMAEKFDYFKFQNTANPFGILFHPLAIEKLMAFALSEKTFAESDIFFHNERWHCFDAHSDCSHSDKEILLSQLNAIVKSFRAQLQKATHTIITYGTAWIYREKESAQIVANCHKIPQNRFHKEIVSVEMIRESIQNTLAAIYQINPSANIIFTVSPVRHIKDGFVENQWSKANLISAIQQELQSKQAFLHYFPSYEIMMDELRDYRFYAEDMLHPNQTAIDYIWKRFAETWISETAFLTMEKVEAIQKSLSHRPFNADSESHQKFLSKIQASISELQKQFPQLHF